MMIFMWVVLPILAFILIGLYLYHKVMGGIVCFKPNLRKKSQRILAVVIVAGLLVPVVFISGIWFLFLMHFTAFLLIIDGIAWIIHKVHKEQTASGLWRKIYKSGILAVLLTAIVWAYGSYNIYHITRAEYTVQTEKAIREDGYKLILLSDLHYGITLDQEQLQNVVESLNKEKADVVILDGDIVDESTTFSQMKEAFRTLGAISSTYGIYYVYGNHDQNNYASKPNYTKEQLADTIEQSGIRILEDETVVLNHEIALIGRADRGNQNIKRKDISELVKNLNPEQEWIVLDHQPAEYDEVQKAGNDIILSGHTHAGQIWPAGIFASLFHFDELNYGEKEIGNLHAIVTSGIAGWGYPVRTERHSEYAVIHVVPD